MIVQFFRTYFWVKKKKKPEFRLLSFWQLTTNIIQRNRFFDTEIFIFHIKIWRRITISFKRLLTPWKKFLFKLFRILRISNRNKPNFFPESSTKNKNSTVTIFFFLFYKPLSGRLIHSLQIPVPNSNLRLQIYCQVYPLKKQVLL